MARNKYIFNPESLRFDKIQLSFRAKTFRFLSYLFASILLAITYYVVLIIFFDTPKEKILQRELNQMTLQYELMQKKLGRMDDVLSNLEETDDNIYRTIFEVEPIPGSIREAGMGGINRYSELEGFNNDEIVIKTAKALDKIRKKMYIQSRSYDDLIELARNKEEMIASVPAIMPISNKDLKRTASGWGMRMHPIYKIPKFHYGMDFTAPRGTEIYATGNGKILSVKRRKTGYGNYIVIDHGYGFETLYGHMTSFNVKKGQKVKRGDVIGFVGSSGTSTAPHVHYEVHKNHKKVNPINYYFNDLTAEEYEKMIEISMKSGQTFD
ncbi:MAG: M23 family metallopeptidase [Bacteroidales bacterium]|nr:M23 family metallopeptidase [Bacteroidales bacterium]